MFGRKTKVTKEPEQELLIVPSQDFGMITKALSKQFELYTSTNSSAIAFGKYLGECVLKGNPTTGKQIIGKIMEGLMKTL
jgi:hypothetical protein